MKKNFLLVLLLCLSVFLFSCGGNDEENNGNQPVVPSNPTEVLPTDEPTKVETPVDEIVVNKNYESLTMNVGETKEYNLADYIIYTGTQYSFICETENKSVVSANIEEGKLIIKAINKGEEQVVISLNNKKITFSVIVTEFIVDLEQPVFKDIIITYSIDEMNCYEILLSPVDSGDYKEFSYSLENENEYVSINDDKLTVTTDKIIELDIVVLVSCDNDYQTQFSVSITTTTEKVVNVVNGSFDNDLEGWTLSGEFGVITDLGTWWTEGLPIYNVGNYFSGYDVDGTSYESETGTLTSSVFTLDGNGYITFMLGGCGNENCYVTVETKDGEVLALYRNTMFKDFPDGFVLGENIEEGKAMVGNSVFMANFVKYKADLTKYIGEELQVVIHDNATSGWGLVFFDELVTYNIDDLEGYVLANNELADLSELKTLLDNAIVEQGDYTESSYETYQALINYGKEVVLNVSIKQDEVDVLCDQILTAIENLEVRAILVKEVSLNKTVIVSDEINLVFSDYFDTNNLSDVTFDAISDEEIVVNEDGVILQTSGMEPHKITITLNALYKGEVKKTVEVSVEVTSDPTPVVKEETVNLVVDFYETDEDVLEFDLSSNIVNVAGLELEYSLLGGEETIVLEDSLFTANSVGLYEYEVEIACEFNNEEFVVSYLLKVEIKDTTDYQLVNGDFEKGTLEGWTMFGPIGDVSNQTNYWLNDLENVLGYEFGLDGQYMFNAYAIDREVEYGSLVSSTFTIGGSGWMTFKIGAAKNTDWVHIEIVDASNGDILATFGNTLWADRTNGAKSGCSLIPYKADLSELLGKEVYIRVVDNAKNDYGLFFLDSFYTYYENEPSDEFNVALDLGIQGNIYEVINGGFEEGLKGWSVYEGEEPGKVSNLDGYWVDNFSFEKDGNYLFHALEGQSYETDPSLEYRIGVLRSNLVVLKANSIISFKLGAAKNDSTGIRFVNAATGEVIGSFYNTEFNKHDGNEGRLMQYVYQFANETEIECYIEIYDNATSDWGLVAVDSIICNLDSKEIENSFEAINQVE